MEMFTIVNIIHKLKLKQMNIKNQRKGVENKKQIILDTIEDLCSYFVLYDRQEDGNLSVEELNYAVDNKIITVDEMVKHFHDCLLSTFIKCDNRKE